MAVEWEFTPVLFASAASVVTAGSLAAYSALVGLRSERTSVVYGFAGLMTATAVWSLGQGVMIALVSEPAMRLAFHVDNLAAFAVPPLWLYTTLAYTDRERWSTRPVLALLWGLPAVAFALTVTNPLYELLLVDVEAVEFAGGVFARREYGPGFLPLSVVGIAMVVAGIAVLVDWLRHSGAVYRGQAAVVALAAAIPITIEVAYIFGPIPDFFNPTALSFSVSGALFAFAIFRYRFLDVVPIARDTVVERMRDGYVVLDADGRVVDYNPAAQSIVGADAVGERAADVFGGDVDLTTDEPDEITVEREGTPRTFEVHVSPLSGDGSTVGRVVSLRDVTDRRRIERRYQTLFEQASDAITVLDGDGTVAYQSPSIDRVLGYDPDELVGEDIFEYVHPEDREFVVSKFREGIREPGELIRLENRFRSAEGEYRVMESVGRNLLENPAVEGVVVNSRDVTERVERERELQEKNERLDEFASLVSHDLRNPLGVAQGYLEVAAEDPETYLPEIATSLDRMEEIVDDVLALARQTDPVEETERIDLEVVARRGWSQVETDGARLDVAESDEVEADPERLQQLFENLFRNAIEHGPADDGGRRDSEDPQEGGSAVWDASTTPDGDRRNGVGITVGVTDEGFYVSDDGQGIPPGDREDVFESGYTTAEEGTGFGLAIVDRIASAHGWSVAATESESGGARFEIEGS